MTLIFIILIMYEQLLYVLIVILLLQFYFSGRNCKIRRSLNNKTILITGGNTGIGKQISRELARYNCHLIIAARNRQNAQKLIKEIIKYDNTAKVEFFYLDLASKKSIEQFSSLIISKLNRIDILINNAGCLCPGSQFTQDGFQTEIGVNYLGHFYLAYLLWGLLKKSDEMRVIMTSSIMHTKATFQGHLNCKKQFNSFQRYSRSKLALIMFTKRLARMLDKNSKSRIVSVHPGVVNTEIFRDLNYFFKIGYLIITPLIWIFMKNQIQGAQTTLYCVFQQTKNLINGAYYSDTKQSRVKPEAEDESKQQQLWRITEQLLHIKFTPS